MSSTRKLWLGLAALLVASFAVLLWVGSLVHQQAPPLPAAVVTSGDETLYTKGDIELGREVWQSIGGQQLGSIWGHGALLAPDWSADWMHREALAMLELLAHDRGAASFDSLDAEHQAALKARVQAEMRTNTYDPATDTIKVSPLRAQAMMVGGAHYMNLFRNDPATAWLGKGARQRAARRAARRARRSSRRAISTVLARARSCASWARAWTRLLARCSCVVMEILPGGRPGRRVV